MTKTTHTTVSCGELGLVKALLLLSIILFTATASLMRGNVPTPLSWLDEDAFVKAIAEMAIRERDRAGIPASITAAQAILESDWGRAPIAKAGNNYFGIKCKSYWTGKTVMHPDDDVDKRGRLIASCFRAYSTVEDSFRDHSDFLRGSDRYATLFGHAVTDYKAWAHGLRRCGYATDKTYGDKLIALIERLNLYALDWPDTEETSWLMLNTESGRTLLEQPRILPAEPQAPDYLAQMRAKQ